MLKRRSKLAPPSWRVFDALVGELPNWWVPVEDEQVPHVVVSERPHMVTYSSPCLRRPSDVVAFQFDLDTDGYGCALMLEVATSEPFGPAEAATLRHRWGEHLDHDLRKWLDDGWPVEPYHVSAYRTDVVDWAALELLNEGQLWRVTEDVWVRVIPDRRFGFQQEVMLDRGALVWVLGRKRTNIRCLGQQPDDLKRAPGAGEVLAGPWYEGQVVVIPFAEFSSRLQRVD
jgi:hypothetical protein